MPYDKDGDFVSMKYAYDEWERFAIGLLVEAAKTYNGFVTYKQLAEFVQDESGVTHDGLIPNWIGELLGRVISQCVKEGVTHRRCSVRFTSNNCLRMASATTAIERRGHAQVLRRNRERFPSSILI